MEKLPANTGWLWVKQGFALFRKQPGEMSTLFILYMFLMVAIGALPIIGQVLPLMLVPIFSICFMQACVNIEQDKRVYPNVLLTGFRSVAAQRLLILGVLYLLAAGGAAAASGLVDDGMFWKLMTGQIRLDAKSAGEANLSGAMLLAAAVYAPAAMAFWFAAPLIAWKNMGIMQALFYSFISVYRNLSAFVVYVLSWFVVGVMMPAFLSAIVGALIGKPQISILLLIPISIVLTVIMYCSFYPTYTRIFGKPESLPPPRIDEIVE